MNRKPAMIHIIRLVTKQIKHLRVHNGHQKVEGIIRIGNNDKECRLFLSKPVEFQFIILCQFTQFLNVKWSKSCTTADKDAFRCFS